MTLLLLFVCLLMLPMKAEAESHRFEGAVLTIDPKAPIQDKEDSILGVVSATRAQGESHPTYSVFKTIRFNEGTNTPFEARIWNTDSGGWPGMNPQIIEILKNGKRMSSTKVGGVPRMMDVWGAVDNSFQGGSNAPYIYILCRHRHRTANGIYTYRINDDYSLTECGVVFLKDELQAEVDRIRKVFEEHDKKNK